MTRPDEQITITFDGNDIIIDAPYRARAPKRWRALGADWRGGLWRAPLSSWPAVAGILRDLYSDVAVQLGDRDEACTGADVPLLDPTGPIGPYPWGR